MRPFLLGRGGGKGYCLSDQVVRFSSRITRKCNGTGSSSFSQRSNFQHQINSCRQVPIFSIEEWKTSGNNCSFFSSLTTTNESKDISKLDVEKIRLLEEEANTTEIFEKVLDDYCRLGQLSDAEKVLNRMEVMAELPDSKVTPLSSHYATLIKAFCSQTSSSAKTNYSNIHGGAQRAEAVLEHMENMKIKKPVDSQQKWMNAIQPDVNCYNDIMKAWILSKEPMFASRAQKVFDKLEKITTSGNVYPNVESFSLMIDAWCSSKEQSSIYKAISMLKRLENFALEQNLNIDSTNTNSDQHTINLDLNTNEEIVNATICYPTLRTYKSVLNRLAHAREKDSAEKANRVLNGIEEKFQVKASNVKPDIECYGLVLYAWSRSKSKHAAERAQNLLSWMEENNLRPDQSCYAHVIRALARQKFLDDAAERADAVLLRMEAVYHTLDASVKPTWEQYYDVISAWGKIESGKNSSEEAVKVLDRMEALPNEDNNGPLISSNAIIYTEVMKSFCNPTADPSNKAKKVYSLLERMIDEYLSGNEESKPTVESYNLIMEVCSKTINVDNKSRMEAFGIATKAFQELREESYCERADNITYRRFLECCSNLLPPGKKQLQALEKIFHSCCRDGQVDGVIHDHFRQWVPFSTYKRMVLSHVDKTKFTLPESWSRNLRTKKTIYSKRRHGGNKAEASLRAHMMRGLREKKNQKLLRGGRI